MKLLAITALCGTLTLSASLAAQPLSATAASRPDEAQTPAAPSLGPQPSSLSVVLNPPSRPWALHLDAELGMLAILSHRITIGSDGTRFDYVGDGGQDNLQLFSRLQAGFRFADRHHLIFVYQPIDLRTEARFDQGYRIGGVDFRQGAAVDLRYGFDFYRASYAYDLLRSPRHELSVGLSMQIRNASISFTQRDGAARYASNDIGLVPALKVRARYTFEGGAFVGFEADGTYATNSFINGASYPFTGAILDTSLRVGARLWGPVEVYGNLRYLGGGAMGTSDDPEAPADGFTENWLHTLSLSLGFGLR
ncbi:MAG: hypothetical protein JNK72_13985 [Myxococcales bacterium]|nr:hypothetical protein [Myxococcales bacterium]